MFSCEFCEISKNTFLTEQLWATASQGKINLRNFQAFYRIQADISCKCNDKCYLVAPEMG